jgi:pilus assembly protein CpaE
VAARQRAAAASDGRAGVAAYERYQDSFVAPGPARACADHRPGQAMKGHSVKVTIVSLDAKSLEHIAALLRTRNPTHQIDKVLGKLDKLPPNSTPDVLVLDQPSIERGDLDAVERLGNVQPRIAFILLCRQQDAAIPAASHARRRARSAALPRRPAPVPGARAHRGKCSGAATTSGKVLAFISCKGGSGATFLATNLAYALAARATAAWR